MSRAGTWGPRALVALLAAAALLWLASATEWVDEKTRAPLSRELSRDGSYVARRMLQSLGVRTKVAEDLTTLPPDGATLVLTAPHWNLVDDEGKVLRGWVERGGHLVVDADTLGSPGIEPWLPVGRSNKGAKAQRNLRSHACRVLAQRSTLPPAFGDERGYVACAVDSQRISSAGAVIWALESEDGGTELLRVPFGQGRVTGFASRFAFEEQDGWMPATADDDPAPTVVNFSNRGLLSGDNAALLAAIVDARPGAEVWFVTRTQRPPLPLWLWQQAAPVLLLCGVALALALWRGGTRFGPLRADLPPVRRSLAAQIDGLADFLFRHQPAALHAAALRALNETAARRVPGWVRMTPPSQSATLARLTGVAETRIEMARHRVAQRNPAAWSDALALLESTRRALDERAGRPSSFRNTP